MLDWTEWASQMWSLVKKYSFIRSLWPWAWWIGNKVECPLHQPLEKDVSQSFWSWRWATWRMTPWSYESCTKGMVLAISPPFPLPLSEKFPGFFWCYNRQNHSPGPQSTHKLCGYSQQCLTYSLSYPHLWCLQGSSLSQLVPSHAMNQGPFWTQVQAPSSFTILPQD